MTPSRLNALVELFSQTLNDTGHLRNAVLAVVVEAQREDYDSEIDRVVQAVSQWAGGTPAAEIMGDSRLTRVSEARTLSSWLCARRGIGWSEIGRAFRRDHSTVLKVCDAFRVRLRDDELLRVRVKTLQAVLDGRMKAA